MKIIQEQRKQLGLNKRGDRAVFLTNFSAISIGLGGAWFMSGLRQNSSTRRKVGLTGIVASTIGVIVGVYQANKVISERIEANELQPLTKSTDEMCSLEEIPVVDFGTSILSIKDDIGITDSKWSDKEFQPMLSRNGITLQ